MAAINSTTLSPGYHFPFAAAPDIIRADQKDTFFQGILLENLSGVLRKLYGAHFVHTYTSEAQTFNNLLYFGCTTLLGSRTLGEEYCDLLQVEAGTSVLPSVVLRSTYIFSSVLLPYVMSKILPSLRNWLRLSLEMSLQTRRNKINAAKPPSMFYRMQAYFIDNLSNITSPSPLYAFSLSVFYFSGAYFHISKRMLGLRYIFTKEKGFSDQHIGYEALGILMILQMTVQTWLHIRNTMAEPVWALSRRNNYFSGDLGLDEGLEVTHSRARTEAISNRAFGSCQVSSAPDSAVLAATTRIRLSGPRYHLAETNVMRWIQGEQPRKCTLCLEEMKDPSVTTCGHVFCWICITDWIREKPKCPLCRQAILIQHVLPMR